MHYYFQYIFYIFNGFLRYKKYRLWSNIWYLYGANTYISAIRTIFFGIVSIAQLVEVTDRAALGDVAEVVSSNPTVGHKNIFQHLPA